MGKMSFAQRVKQKAKDAEFSGGSDTLRLKDGMSFYKPVKGKNEILVVPFKMDLSKNLDDVEVGDLWFRLPILKHFNIGAEGKSVICPKTIGKKCPICEHRAALLSQGKSPDDQEVRDLAARKRELYYVINVQEDGSPQVFEYSYHNFGRKLEEEIREADDDSLAANFADPDDGAVVVFRMSEETFGKNKFLAATRVDFEERSKDDTKAVKQAMQEVEPFGKMIVVKSYEELKNLFYDISPEDAEEPEDVPEEKPARSRKDSGEEKEPERKRKVRPSEDAPDDADDPEPEPEPEPEQKPKRRKPSDEDEETQEAPAPRRRRKVEQEPEDDPEEKPAPRRRRHVDEEQEAQEPEETPKRKAPAGKQKCPNGGVFGKDCDTLDECEECDHWSDCRDLADKAKNSDDIPF